MLGNTHLHHAVNGLHVVPPFAAPWAGPCACLSAGFCVGSMCCPGGLFAWVRFVEGNRGLVFGADKSLFGSWAENVSGGESRAPCRVFYFVFSNATQGNDLQLLATTL